MATPLPRLEMRSLSSLSKVFADGPLADKAVARGSALAGEVYAFQVAYRGAARLRNLTVTLTGPLEKSATIRTVDLVPSELPYLQWDKDMIRRAPGLYPDLLSPLPEGGLEVLPDQWRSLWITVAVPPKARPGNHPFTLTIREKDRVLGRARHTLVVAPARFVPSPLIQTQWFHSDCLATFYGVPVGSEAWWGHVAAFMKNAVAHHINMILTPLFTPPLDTKVGGERPTVQLVKVTRSGKKYAFDFTDLKRWIRVADQAGVAWFEMSHLFSQWGAKFAPKIIVREKGRDVKAFGWHTPATGKAYRDFLDQFLPALVAFIDKEKIRDRCYFHVSDEPYMDALETYGAAVEIVRRHLGDFPIIDALSNVEYYKQGLVRKPVPANNHIEPFVEAKVPGLWTYYCVSQWKEVPNRYFNMASARNRIMGVLLYKYNIEGFLHWGFNFYHRQYSVGPVDPFRNTDAGNGFPSGDSFLVYPGPVGPLDSLRHEVHREGIQDLAALQQLEKKWGRAKTLAFLESGLKKPLSMTRYPKDPAWILRFRERINRALS